MKVDIFTIADSVNVYGGKLVIVGTFDNIQAEKCPFIFKPFGIALKMSVEPNEYGKTYDGRLVLRKILTKKSVAKITFRINFPERIKGKRVSAIFAGSFGNIKFDSFGLYIFEFIMGSKRVSRIYFSVVESKKKAKKKAKKKPKKKAKKKPKTNK